MSVTAPPKVLARKEFSVPNGRRVQLTGQCVPDGDGGLVLAPRVDGREVARATGREAAPGVAGRARRHAEPPRLRASRQPWPRRDRLGRLRDQERHGVLITPGG